MRKNSKKQVPKAQVRKLQRQTIRSSQWKKSKTISKDKYDPVGRAILKTLKNNGMRWGVLTDQVQALLPDFEGSVWWFTLSVLRELETQGKVQREPGPPVLYSKVPKKQKGRKR